MRGVGRTDSGHNAMKRPQLSQNWSAHFTVRECERPMLPEIMQPIAMMANSWWQLLKDT